MPALSIRGWDEEGHPLLLGEETGRGLPSVAEVLFPDPAARPILFLETLDRLLVLSYEPPGRGGRRPVHFALTASAGEERVPIGVLYESGTVTIEGARLQVDMTFRPILQAERLPGAREGQWPVSVPSLGWTLLVVSDKHCASFPKGPR